MPRVKKPQPKGEAGASRHGKIIFVTGTDTGVGKTVLSAVLLGLLRDSGLRVEPLKPFCSGNRSDVRILREAAGSKRSLKAINPWFYAAPVAPLAALKPGEKGPTLAEIIRTIKNAAKGVDYLIVEGAGGLLVPVSQGVTVLDVIEKVAEMVVLVSRDKLGTLNHTGLSLKALKNVGNSKVLVVLSGGEKGDVSRRSNERLLSVLWPETKFLRLGEIDTKTPVNTWFIGGRKFFQKTIAQFEVFTHCVWT
jgi:dethiobiotin synthetase